MTYMHLQHCSTPVYRICMYVVVLNLHVCMYALRQGRTAVADCSEVKL